MTIPLIIATNSCGSCLPEPDVTDSGKLNTTARVLVASLVAETLFVITALVVSILGLLSVLIIPAALSYTLLGLSCAVLSIWIFSVVHTWNDEEMTTLQLCNALVRAALGLAIE